MGLAGGVGSLEDPAGRVPVIGTSGLEVLGRVRCLGAGLSLAAERGRVLFGGLGRGHCWGAGLWLLASERVRIRAAATPGTNGPPRLGMLGACATA